eukprot:TRINITY_DN84893_c0_g1_i1.p1 TRINITY_DN84893_c0_g1~~TRINITY_DN84893_c0_g1_i1.p1  ORF type:complete len:293 (+),score=36.07 TRINITY_DN84893_c0_g1_i1:40-918(+)
MESEVMMLQSAPEAVKIRIHVEMYLETVMKLCWMHEEQLLSFPDFTLKLCHLATREVAAGHLDDIFKPQAECDSVMIVTHGRASYSCIPPNINRPSAVNVMGSSRAMKPGEHGQLGMGGARSVSAGTTIAEVCFWADWMYKGHLFAEGACYYVRQDADMFRSLVIAYGGDLYDFMRTFGILFVSSVEELLNDCEQSLTDLDQSEQCEAANFVPRAQNYRQELKQLREAGDLLNHIRNLPLGGKPKPTRDALVPGIGPAADLKKDRRQNGGRRPNERVEVGDCDSQPQGLLRL